jgi:hypothetical protein
VSTTRQHTDTHPGINGGAVITGKNEKSFACIKHLWISGTAYQAIINAYNGSQRFKDLVHQHNGVDSANATNDPKVDDFVRSITSNSSRTVLPHWGFRAKYDYGTSVTSLMTGPPGTGKTMAPALIARELGLELYRVALPQIVSKWIGETEKNIDRIFEFSEQHGVALLFDEADSLFGKRGTLETAADKYANLETNFLLQRLEQFDGVAFLTTNLEKGIDEAFERRIRFRIEFPEPDVEMRERLWRTMIPRSAVIASKIDWPWLAETFELSGAQIKEAVLAAAFQAAERQSEINTDLLCLGANAQYRKKGKLATIRQPL